MATETDIYEIRYDASDLDKAARLAANYAKYLDLAADETDDLAASQARAEVAMRRIKDAAGAIHSGTGNANFAVVQLTRSFQDLAAAGPMAIANNIEGLFLSLKGVSLTTLLGALWGPAGLIAAFTALAQYGPQIGQALKDAFDWLAGLGPDIDDVVAGIRKMGEEADKSAAKAQRAGAAASAAFRGPAEMEAGRNIAEILAGAGPETEPALVQREIERRLLVDEAARKALADRAQRQAAAEAAEARQAAAREARDPMAAARAANEARAARDAIARLNVEIQNRREALAEQARAQVAGVVAGATGGDPLARMQLAAGFRDIGREAEAARIGRQTAEQVRFNREQAERMQAAGQQIRDAAERAGRQAQEAAGGGWERLFGRDRGGAIDESRRRREERAAREAGQQQKQAEAEAERQAREDAARFGGGMEPQIQAALIRGAGTGQLAQQAAAQMRAAGLEAARAGPAAQVAVAEAAGDLQARIAELMNQGFRREQALHQIVGELQATVLQAQNQNLGLQDQIRKLQANQWQVRNGGLNPPTKIPAGRP